MTGFWGQQGTLAFVLKRSRRWWLVQCAWVLFLSNLGCASNDEPVSLEQKAVARLEACGLVSGNKLSLPAEGERAQCQLRCLGKMLDCADVEVAFCHQDWVPAIDCLHACYSHKCGEITIPSDALCDGTIDCADNSDEEECGPNWMMDCKGDESVHSSKWCDDHVDCVTQNDELNCEDAPRFICKDGTSIPAQKECDGELDCAVFTDGPGYQLVHDGSDELHCSGASFFSCGDGSYIKHSQQCDARDDCVDGKDEPVDCAVNTCRSLPQ